ncbi:hypothetical protein KM176_19135 [Pseudooceanicola sp. CBS1P-1]|uniref:Uncharacterized protein n=1 Tax=Pseudooceanicola albus TaxID=2692189 RepID=A0A6L7G639_9RHOB|nr:MULTISPECIES: hypothetical protein [Pseudooceanicola]MBT9385994.1 hypothetical protein [Pseudooceanicola endophyticus]MXN19585.1 hypothetical protein [Pseudooceanicola albus]
MNIMQTTTMARALYRAQGPRAELALAEKIRDCLEQGRREEAEEWAELRRQTQELRRPRQG